MDQAANLIGTNWHQSSSADTWGASMHTYSPHPFCWRPAAENRHATTERPRDGEEFTALCGASGTADLSEIAWFSATCVDCNRLAHELAAVPMQDQEPSC